jgi:hypothetical protein
MKIKCITTVKDNLADSWQEVRAVASNIGLRSDDTYSDLCVGRVYVPLALIISDGTPLVVIRSYECLDTDYCTRPLACFEILDATMSKYWEFRTKVKVGRSRGGILRHVTIQTLAFSDWFAFKDNRGRSFYELAFDREQTALKLMNIWADKLEAEAGLNQ